MKGKNMKKSKLLVFSLASVLMLAGCGDNQTSSSTEGASSSNTSEVVSSSEESSTSNSSSEISSSESSSEVVIETATIKKITNYVTEGTLNVTEGDKVELNSKITLTFTEAVSDKEYQILVNQTIADMEWAEDNLSCFYTLNASKDEEISIALIEKNPTSENGQTITFEQGEHYKVLGIVSGQKYEPLDDYSEELEDWITVSIDFAIIVDEGYILAKPILTVDGIDQSLSKNDQGLYSIGKWDLTGAGALTINVNKAVEHTITYTGAENLDTAASNIPTTFMGGDTITFKFIAKEGFSVTAVSVQPYDNSYYYQKDYSNYTITLPNEDVQIAITTVASYAIKLSSTEHLSNIGFYSTAEYGSDSEGNTALKLSDEITTAPSNQRFYVAFNVEDGYKVSEIVGAEVAGLAEGTQSWCGSTDGRIVFNCTIYGETELKPVFVTKKSVTLDSSTDSDKVSLVFTGDVNTFFPEDDVKFNFLLEDTKNTRIGQVYYCYTDENGEAVEKEINYSKYYSSYTFVMPNADVTIKAEVIDIIKTTVSYSNTAGSLVGSVNIVGATSGTKLDDSTSTSDSFEEKESLNITIKAGPEHFKKVAANLVTATETTAIELTLNIAKGTYTGSVSVPVGGATIQIVEGEYATVRTLTASETSTIEYYESTDVSSKVNILGNLYDMDVFYFVVKDTPAEGYSLSVSVKIDGEEVPSLSTVTIGDETAYKVIVSGNVEISVEQVQAVSFGVSGADYEGDGSDIFIDFDTNDYIQVNNGTIKYGTRFYLDDPDYGREIETITIGGETVKPDYIDGFHGVYAATGDVVITLIEAY